MDKAKTALAVLIFPTLQQNFNIVDDMAELPALARSKKSPGKENRIMPI